MLCYEMLININTFPDFSLPKNVKDYERFSFVTGEKQETRNDGRSHPDSTQSAPPRQPEHKVVKAEFQGRLAVS